MVKYASCPRGQGERYHGNGLKKPRKKFEEIFKKVLTKGKRCDIIVKLSARNSKRSLKIEQQERSTKHSMCERTDLVNQELYILNKVKEAKN